eukprot:3205790-Pleurochrysis_carterae.AAC.1
MMSIRLRSGNKLRYLCNLAETINPILRDWRKLDYSTLEVSDTAELKELEVFLKQERDKLLEQYRVGKEENRKVVRVNAELGLARIDRVESWAKTVLQDKRRAW